MNKNETKKRKITKKVIKEAFELHEAEIKYNFSHSFSDDETDLLIVYRSIKDHISELSGYTSVNGNGLYITKKFTKKEKINMMYNYIN